MIANAGCPQESESPAFPALHDTRYAIHRVADRVEPYLRALVSHLRPEKVILFGSYAYGQPSEHSDIDLLMIRRWIRSEQESNLEIRRLFRAVSGRRPSFTLLSKTSERITNRLAVKSPFCEDILRKGLIVYAAETV